MRPFHTGTSNTTRDRRVGRPVLFSLAEKVDAVTIFRENVERMAAPHPAFSHILGQADAISFLSRALAGDRLPHGFIFAGPVGVGRVTTAMALASIFLADDPKDPASIDKVGVLLRARTHFDFHFVTKELVRNLEGKSANKAIDMSVDVIREHVLVPAGRKSVTGRGKVFIIDEADLMTTAAQNALLKTLEEPAGRTLIVLISDQPGSLLSTIRSRAQMVRFAPIAPAEAMKILARHKIEPAVASAAIELAGGSPGQALAWITDDVVAASARLLALIGQPANAAALAIQLKDAADAYAKKQLEHDPAGSEDGFKRLGLTTYLRIIADHLRAALPHAGSIADAGQICKQIESISRTEQYVDGNVNLSLALQQIAGDLS